MENLLALLDKIQQLSPLPVFSSDVIIIQNPGMQHWLNLSLAQQRGISMNIDYALPSQFLWKLIRTVADDESIPEQSLFSREVLTWKIHQLLASPEVINSPDFSLATAYWQSDLAPTPQQSSRDECSANEAATSGHNTADNVAVDSKDDQRINSEPDATQNETQSSTQNTSQSASLKRYQLACQMADLFEQYLIFRPEWIDNWQQGIFSNFIAANANANHSDKPPGGPEDSGALDIEQANHDDINTQALWQGKLWHLLTQEQSYNPIEFVQRAIKNLASKADILPQRISFFGINAMAPLWLDFINALSEHTQVHFFHLNPCYAYWGDVLTEKQAIKSIDNWVSGVANHDNNSNYTDTDTDGQGQDSDDEYTALVGNPLLANLGQQGREFMALLHNYSTINIEAFEAITDEVQAQSSENTPHVSLLHRVQHDVLSLIDARTTPSLVDDASITITSCHSALREVQGFHDWLLAQFNADASITPKDVLVMCPQIEEYAPYVNAVFTHGWQDIDDKVPPLPCSIADRVSKDSQPMVAAFMQLLTLPDSRFQVSQLMTYLRLPALQVKFDLSENELDKISTWLSHACIHWGLDSQHKESVLGISAGESHVKTFSQFTWQEGLSRLLRGFAFSEHERVYQNQVLLPYVEGNDAVLLGKLMLVVEQLSEFTRTLSKARSAAQWLTLLQDLLENLFDTSQDPVFETLYNGIAQLSEYCEQANYEEDIALAIVQDFLNNHFSTPEPGRHFLVGQVTFCSMLPMRSIPFKIIAVLGLNDGDFPRQRQPMGFDLMANTPAKLGDRSRRGDDRYMFLEALISARKALYLSYQGRSIRNDNEKQPSIVLKELMDYLSTAYGWQCDVSQAPCQIRQLPMQPFSLKNYTALTSTGLNTDQEPRSENTHCQEKVSSQENVLGQAIAFNSFDPKWLALALTKIAKENTQQITNEQQSASHTINVDQALTLSSEQLIRFFGHPVKHYAQQALQLHYEDNRPILDDIEPFDFNALDSYLYRQKMLGHYLNVDSDEQANDGAAKIQHHAMLSGHFPDLPHSEKVLEQWGKGTEIFADYITQEGANAIEIVPVTLRLDKTAELPAFSITVNFPLTVCPVSAHARTAEAASDGENARASETASESNETAHHHFTHYKLAFHRSSTAKSKDFFTLYLHQLLLQIWQEQQTSTATTTATETSGSLSAARHCHGYYFDTKSQKITQYYYQHIEQPQEKLNYLLRAYMEGQFAPSLINIDLAEKSLAGTLKSKGKPKPFLQNDFEQYWADENSFSPLGKDPYIAYFWPTCPQFSDLESALRHLYQDYIQSREQVKIP